MFNKLKKKLMLHLMPSILIMLLFLFVTLCMFLSHILVYDFTQKSIQFSKQAANSIAFNLKTIEETTTIFINKYNVMDIISSSIYDPSLASQLKEISSYNSAIRDMAIYGIDGLTYSSSGYYSKDFRNYIMDHDFFSLLENRKKIWLFKKEADLPSYYPYGTDVILYMSSIQDYNGNICGYVIADISPIEITKNIKNQNNIFFNNATIFMVFNKNEVLTVSSENNTAKAEKEIREFMTLKKDYKYIGIRRILLINSGITDMNIDLFVYLPLKYVNDQLNTTTYFFIALFIIIIVLCYLFMHYLISGIIDPLLGLYLKIQNYITQQKF